MPEFNLADNFEAVADAVPDRPALVVEDRRLSYRELDERSNRLAHHLAANGVGVGDHVGIQAMNGVEYIETLLAAMKLRAVPVNVNYRYVADELRYLYRNADLVALVCSRQYLDVVAEAAPAAPTLGHVVHFEDGSDADPEPAGAVEYEAALAASRPDRDFPARSGDDLIIIYTGGTTGMPKGVMWGHTDIFFALLSGGNPAGEPVADVAELAANAAAKPAPGVSFPVAPLMHGAATCASLIAFDWGDTLVLLPRFEAEEVWRLCEAEGVITLNLVGDAMARPMADALAEHPGRWDLSSIFVVSSAGAILSKSVRDRLHEHLPHVMIVDAFGSTEGGNMGYGTADSSPDEGLRFDLHDRTVVIDDDGGLVQPGSGVMGRLAVRGYLPVGYYKDPEKTAATFPVIDGVRYTIPGDLATIEADGTVRVFGRGSVCINTGGEKVFPEEVEAALKGHPEVFDAVVVGVADEQFGQRVTALVTARDGTAPTEAGIRQHARDKVAGYKVPKQVWLVDEIVRSPSGKADYPWAQQEAARLAGA